MTHLRQMMLEELERRNYAQTTTRITSVRWKISRATLIVLPTSSVPSTSASTKPICSASGSSPQHRHPTAGRAAFLLH